MQPEIGRPSDEFRTSAGHCPFRSSQSLKEEHEVWLQ